MQKRVGPAGDGLDLQQLLRLHAGVEAHALRTVGTILGTAARFDAQQGTDLHAVRYLIKAMHVLRPEQQVHEW
jgi:hypothetical protein